MSTSKALVLIDLQNDFITGSLGTKESREIVDNLVQLIDSWDDDIYITKDTHDFNYLNTLEGRMLPVKHCIAGTEGYDLEPKIKEALYNRRNINVFQKNTFGSIGLMNALTHYSEIYICGLCTDVCVITNALLLRTRYPNTRILCLAQYCAGTTPERHKEALNIMDSCQIEIM